MQFYSNAYQANLRRPRPRRRGNRPGKREPPDTRGLTRSVFRFLYSSPGGSSAGAASTAAGAAASSSFFL